MDPIEPLFSGAREAPRKNEGRKKNTSRTGDLDASRSAPRRGCDRRRASRDVGDCSGGSDARAARTSVVVRGLRSDAREDDLVDRVVVLPEPAWPSSCAPGSRRRRLDPAGPPGWRAPRAVSVLGTYGRTPPARGGSRPRRARARGDRSGPPWWSRAPATPATGREGAERAERGPRARGPRARPERPPARYSSRVFWERGVASEATTRLGGVGNAARAKKEQVVARVGQTDASRGRVSRLTAGDRYIRARSPKIRSNRNISRGFFAFPFARLRPLRNSRRDRAALARTIARETSFAARPPGFTPQYRPAPSKR